MARTRNPPWWLSSTAVVESNRQRRFEYRFVVCSFFTFEREWRRDDPLKRSRHQNRREETSALGDGSIFRTLLVPVLGLSRTDEISFTSHCLLFDAYWRVMVEFAFLPFLDGRMEFGGQEARRWWKSFVTIEFSVRYWFYRIWVG